MKDWFDSLESRERNFVSFGAIVVIVVLLYGLGWAPLDKKHDTLKADVENWQRSLTNLRPMRTVNSSGGQNQPVAILGSQQTPIIIVDQTLTSRGLDRYLRRSQPTAGDGIRVEFENVAFDELVLWLGDLSEQYAMHVQAGSFSTGNQASLGRVNATLTLERAL